MNCPQCNADMDYSVIVKEQVSFAICEDCIEKMPRDLRESQVYKNIQTAKVNRALGNSPWDSKK